MSNDDVSSQYLTKELTKIYTFLLILKKRRYPEYSLKHLIVIYDLKNSTLFIRNIKKRELDPTDTHFTQVRMITGSSRLGVAGTGTSVKCEARLDHRYGFYKEELHHL